ncbi:MAG: AI-2E family transporter [Spirochaetales bacterium]|nr:AI-2E family transporter [Spirochaetales bacterium]
MDVHKELFFIRNLLLMLVAIVAVVIMKSLSGILLPLVLAVLMSVLFLPLILFLEKKKFPTGISVALIAIITIGIILMVANVFISTINEIISQQDYLVNQLYTKFQELAALAAQIPYLEIDAASLQSAINNLLSRDMLTSAASGLFKGASSFGSSFLMFTLYFLFLLPGMSRYQHFIRYVGGNRESILEDYEKIQKNISTYMVIKSVISLITGTIAWFICTVVGLKFAFFWGFLTFVLNFIPSIGSIIATILPSLMGLILLDSFNEFILLAALLGTNQLIIGNVLDPRIMGNRMRLNTVTVLFGLVFWGVIWGIPGMLLSVPLSVTLKLILEKSSSWSFLARLMGSSVMADDGTGHKKKRRSGRRKKTDPPNE